MKQDKSPPHIFEGNQESSKENIPVIQKMGISNLVSDVQTYKNNFSNSYQQLARFSSQSKKNKIAPRSSLQFKLGPPYGHQVKHVEVYAMSTNKPVLPILTSRIDRGFDNIKNTWIGYKRNYFTSVAAFQMVSNHSISLDSFLKDRFYINVNHQQEEIQYFAMRLVASCCEDLNEMDLVQHTAKRDKGPQIKPPIHPIVLGELPSHEIIRDASNVKNDAKKKKYDADFFLHKDNLDLSYLDPDSILFNYPMNDIIKVARYERVQFSTSINQKRPPNSVKHFKLTTVLGVVVNGNKMNFRGENPIKGAAIMIGDNQTFIPVVSKSTPSLVIRGRSPSNYPTGIVADSESVEIDFLTTENPCKGNAIKIHEINTGMENRFITHLIKNERGPVNDFECDFPLNTFDSENEIVVNEMRKSSRNKNSSIKFANKIRHPPLLSSSRPSTSNVEGNKKQNTLYLKNKMDETPVQIVESNYFLENCDDTADIENLLMEQLIQNKNNLGDTSSVNLHKPNELKKFEFRMVEPYSDINDSINSNEPGYPTKTSYDHHTCTKPKGSHSFEMTNYSEYQTYSCILSNPSGLKKRGVTQSFETISQSSQVVSPWKRHCGNHYMKSSKEKIGREIVRLIPQSDFKEFFTYEKLHGENDMHIIGSKTESREGTKELGFGMVSFTSDNSENLNSDEENISDKSKLDLQNEYCVDVNKLKNYSYETRFEGIGSIIVEDNKEEDIMRVPRAFASRETSSFLDRAGSNIERSNLLFEERIYRNEGSSIELDKNIANESF
ncbi:hypothetical protein QEN19_004310 [Hanseniaspora menglaensis]